MKDLFIGYYSLSEEAYKRIWNDAIIVLDTNVLLDFYRVSSATSKNLLSVLEEYKDRIYLPYQVASEYHRRMTEVIAFQIQKYEDSISSIRKFENLISDKRNHPFLPNELEEKVKDTFTSLKGFFKEQQEALTDVLKKKSIKDKIADLYTGKIGNQITSDELDKLCKDGEERYKKCIPPGYEDRKKSSPDKFGDLIIWLDVINYCKSKNKPAIFVSNDEKIDWTWKLNKTVVGPCPELIKEFKDITGQSICFFNLFSFLEKSKEMGIDVHEDVLDELKERRESESIARPEATESSIEETSRTENTNTVQTVEAKVIMGGKEEYSSQDKSLPKSSAQVEVEVEDIAKK